MMNGSVMIVKKMNKKEVEAIETLRALDGKIMKKYPFDNGKKKGYIAAFSEEQAVVLYRKNIMKKKETDVGIVIEDW